MQKLAGILNMTQNQQPQSKPDQPDQAPKNLYIGAINPYALCEAILGRQVDRRDPASAGILADTLQRDYEELFDMKHNSVLYAGLQLNAKGDRAEPVPNREMHTLTERDMVSPDLSSVQRVNDLADIGLKDIGDTRVKSAFMQNGHLRLVLSPKQLGRTLTNTAVTQSMFELMTPFRKHKGEWSPPNSSWQDISSERFQAQQMQQAIAPMLQGPGRFDGRRQGYNPVTQASEPVQGALGNSWLIAAMCSVAWADPAAINHFHRQHGCKGPEPGRGERRTLQVKFHSKGGDNDASTGVVEVDCTVPVNNSNNQIVYCRSSGPANNYGAFAANLAGARADGLVAALESLTLGGAGAGLCGEIWPAMYEKAFAKWITRERGEHPDITQTSYGDPVKAMAQLTDREPQYFFCDRRSEEELIGMIRMHSVNSRTVYPMCAWTRPTGQREGQREGGDRDGGDRDHDRMRDNSMGNFRGSNLVANMAYTVLGWASPAESRRQFVVLRHPWGTTEAPGLCDYPGLVDMVDKKFWRPADLISGGVFALEMSAFKECFEGVGIAK